MKDLLAWGLKGARQQTLSLVEDIPAELSCSQSVPGEHHPVWTLGHLLLGDSHLLPLLGAAELPSDFPTLLSRYGPGADPVGSPEGYDAMAVLVRRLTETGVRRQEALAAMVASDLARPTPDPLLASSQPNMGHHLQALMFHEGYHAGRLAAWRRRQGLPAAPWVFAPPGP